MAHGVPHTHAAKSRLTLEGLARWAGEITGDNGLVDRVRQGNTARHAFDMLWPDYPEVIRKVGLGMVAAAQVFAGSDVAVSGVIFGFDGELVFNSEE
jgi:cobalt-precorrin-5B (C1)-methyltransferase